MLKDILSTISYLLQRKRKKKKKNENIPHSLIKSLCLRETLLSGRYFKKKDELITSIRSHRNYVGTIFFSYVRKKIAEWLCFSDSAPHTLLTLIPVFSIATTLSHAFVLLRLSFSTYIPTHIDIYYIFAFEMRKKVWIPIE